MDVENIKFTLYPNIDNHMFASCFTLKNICDEIKFTELIKSLVPTALKTQRSSKIMKEIIFIDQADSASDLISNIDDDSYQSLTSSSDNNSSSTSSSTVDTYIDVDVHTNISNTVDHSSQIYS